MNSISTGSYDEFSAWLSSRVAGDPTDPVDYWYPIAEQAIKNFATKEGFMSWVRSYYGGDQNRMAASCCWDIVRLEESE